MIKPYINDSQNKAARAPCHAPSDGFYRRRAETIKVQIVGQEDVFQKELVKNVLDVLKELQCGCELEVVRELKEILEMEKCNILITPALIVNGHILCEGNIWTKDHIKHFLERAAAERSP